MGHEKASVSGSIGLEPATSVEGDGREVCAFYFDPESKKLRVLDQTLLPEQIKYIQVDGCNKGYSVIRSMQVRGAPCIAAVGCLSLIVELNRAEYLQDPTLKLDDIIENIQSKSQWLISSRPTAVNLKNALNCLTKIAEKCSSSSQTCSQVVMRLTESCLTALEAGKAANKRLGDYGASAILDSPIHSPHGAVVLTHCNTGSLATVGYGTALGTIRSLRDSGSLKHVYCTETRPCNQGSRLTAWELVKEKIPATLITDSMVAYLMATHSIDAVIVGADCVATNGDTANKIGTLQVALIAKHYKVPFFVAAPTQSFNLGLKDGKTIPIELRSQSELKKIHNVTIAPDEIDVWNPSFDVTPSEYIAGIITEHGICKPSEVLSFFSMLDQNALENPGDLDLLF